jgi:hypothetical protein
VCLDAGVLSLLGIYCSYVVVLLAPYGRRFDVGLVLLGWTLELQLTILFSSFTQQVVVEHGGLFCSLFGL